jgi:hypothetical protein
MEAHLAALDAHGYTLVPDREKEVQRGAEGFT